MRPDEAVRSAFDLPDLRGGLILGVAPGTERCPFHQLRNFSLLTGDLVVYLPGDAECTDDEALN